MHSSVRRKAKTEAAEHKKYLLKFLLGYASSLFVYVDMQMNLVDDKTCKVGCAFSSQ
jgi:hypothetical protein